MVVESHHPESTAQFGVVVPLRRRNVGRVLDAEGLLRHPGVECGLVDLPAIDLKDLDEVCVRVANEPALEFEPMRRRGGWRGGWTRSRNWCRRAGALHEVAAAELAPAADQFVAAQLCVGPDPVADICTNTSWERVCAARWGRGWQHGWQHCGCCGRATRHIATFCRAFASNDVSLFCRVARDGRRLRRKRAAKIIWNVAAVAACVISADWRQRWGRRRRHGRL